MSTRSKKTFVLNKTAAFIWKFCDGRMSVDCLAQNLVRAAGGEARRVHDQVLRFCQEMQNHGLLLPVQASAAQHGTTLCAYRDTFIPPSISQQHNGIGFRGRPSSRGVSGPG